MYKIFPVFLYSIYNVNSNKYTRIHFMADDVQFQSPKRVTSNYIATLMLQNRVDTLAF